MPDNDQPSTTDPDATAPDHLRDGLAELRARAAAAEADPGARAILHELEQLAEHGRHVDDVNTAMRVELERARAREQHGIPTVTQALAEAARNVLAVGKDRSADEKQGGYKFRGIDGVLGAVHGPITAAGVIPIPHDEIVERERWEFWSGSWFLYRVKIRWQFIGPAGDSFEVTNWGEALDNADKGLGKARSYAMKDLLIRIFTIPTTDPDMGDTEHTAYGDPVEQDQPQRSRGQQPVEKQPDTFHPATPEDIAWVQTAIAGADGPHRDALRKAWKDKFGPIPPEHLDAAQMRQARALVRGMIPGSDEAAERAALTFLLGMVEAFRMAWRGPTAPEGEPEGDATDNAPAEPGEDDSDVAAAVGDDTSERDRPTGEERSSIAAELAEVVDRADSALVDRIAGDVKALHHAHVDRELRDELGIDTEGLHIDSRRMLLTMHRIKVALGETPVDGQPPVA